MEWLDKLPPEKRAVAEKVAAAARKHGVPVNLALGMAMQESAFDQSKRSGTGPVGVMQVSRTLGKEYKINPKNIDQNIDAGIRFMKRNLDKYGNVDDALVAYHDGPSSAYFKGGQMSPAAANHIMKVKGYAGMATDNKAAPETAFSTDIEDIAPVELMAEEAAVMGGRRPRDINDLMGGLAGAGIGYGIGKTREMSKHQKEMTLSAQRLALQQQRAEQEALDRAAETKKGPQFGSGTENWKNVEFGEPIARQIVNPLDKPSAARQGQAAVARHERASQLFPTQIPAGEGSLLTIPVTTGGSARVPMPAPEAPAPAVPTARPAGQQPAMGVLKAPGRVSTAATTGLGGLAGAQAYDTWQNIKEGNYPAAFQSGLSSVEAALAAGARNPKVKAITGGIAGATAFGPELVDYIREVLGSQPPVEQKAKGGLIGVPAKEGFAPYGLRHSGEGMKGHGYFGLLPSKEGISSEISVEDDSGEFPTMVPTLTQEELNYLLSGQEPTEEIYQKARSWADTRRARGQSPFAERGELQMPVPGFAGGGILEKGVKKGVQSVLSHLAERYPSLIPGELRIDPKTGKQFIGKAMSPEEEALQAARKAAQKDIEKGNYTPFFDVSQRFHADPSNYPLPGRTITEALPKKANTITKYREMFDTPVVAQRLKDAFHAAKDDPLTHNWYAMGQLEDAFIRELGPVEGRKMFKERFADAMAATTGGADPTSNLLSSYYGNYMRQAGRPTGTTAIDFPHPVGGRYISGNIDQYNKIINQGGGLGVGTPKRFNFSSNFLGHTDRPTLDEQMSGIFDPRLKAPPGDSYGVMEGILNKAAAAEGVTPVNFQEVAWAGQKGTKGKPMIQHVNEAIERTSRVTGKTPDEVVRDSLIHARSPLYGGAIGLTGLGQLEDER